VGAIFVNYLQQLLGTSKSIIPLASAVIHSGPCLSFSSMIFSFLQFLMRIFGR
jgi:hypothetical protein